MQRTTRALGSALALVGLVAMMGAATGPGSAPAAASGQPPSGPGPQLTTVHFGSPLAISDAGVFFGRARGFFQAQGIDVDILPFQSGNDIIAPMAAGDLQVAGGGLSLAVLNAIDRGIRIRAVADKGTSRPGFEFVQLPVRRDLLENGAVRAVGDLRGRHVGVSTLRASGEAIIAQVLATGGLSVDDVDLVPMGYPDMVVALGNQAIDAAVLIEPALGAAYARGVIGAWDPGMVSAAYGGNYQAALLFFNEQLAGQPDLARRFMTAYLQGVRVYNDAFVKGQGRAEAVQVLIDSTQIKDPAAYDQMQMAALDPDGQIYRPSLQTELDYHRARGYYTGSATLDSLLDPSFAQAAAQQLGPYQ
ncbi:MAG TPA: ABC transporter substrate-binding protein [Chloroflexota bacterium]|nr:ABC transporter substrate-binding protein [Chloroflexota bacterium]